MKLLQYILSLPLLILSVSANCELGSSCSNICCSGCSSPTYFCNSNGNPFGLTCQSGTCELPPPCAKNTCFTTHFNSQAVQAPSSIVLIASFKPKFSGSAAAVSFTNSYVSFNGVASSVTPPNSYIELSAGQQSCSTANYVNGQYETTAPLPGSGNTFLDFVSVPVPAGTNYANAQLTWCGDINAPGEIDVQISAAVYSSCPQSSAAPEACETHTQYHAGVPTGCLGNLMAGGTGGGGSNYGGSQSATYEVCKP